jgi:hypothetical protein
MADGHDYMHTFLNFKIPALGILRPSSRLSVSEIPLLF